MVAALDDPPVTARGLFALLNDNDQLKALQVHLAFVHEYMDPVYKLIASFQQESGGPSNPLDSLTDIKKTMSRPSNGYFTGRVQKLSGKLSGAQSMRVVQQLKSAAKVMHDKVDSLQAKTIKGQANT
uniref:Uncharacterized protein n=1 Tax=Eutreptiella gymnastica TaxID=73025 RepID=A0A7S1JGP9_9EUGL|mmetsp:Transcript_95562/g.164812  ORF Transcript_95562/g.164812 Transcript_95562/m.164812 type:complete len:127 (+) Transcript_95562:139-519(+)